MTHIELHPAFMWYCPRCSTKNYIEPEKVILTDEEMEEFAERAGCPVEVLKKSMPIAAPKALRCFHCREKFTINKGE